MSETATASESGGESNQDTETGLDENIAAALSYVLGFLTGLIMYLVETENDHVRFHAAQSMVVFCALFVASVAISFVETAVSFIDFIGAFLSLIFGLVGLGLWIGGFGLWIYLIIRTYQEENPRLPVAAGIADDLV